MRGCLRLLSAIGRPGYYRRIVYNSDAVLKYFIRINSDIIFKEGFEFSRAFKVVEVLTCQDENSSLDVFSHTILLNIVEILHVKNWTFEIASNKGWKEVVNFVLANFDIKMIDFSFIGTACNL